MFREATTQAEQFDKDEGVWPVLNRISTKSLPTPSVVHDAGPFRPAPAAPDIPVTVGALLFASYLGLIAALAIATAGPGQSAFALVIAGLFVVAFFTVPRLILSQEPDQSERVSMERFMATGLETYTGHCSGGSALVQILIVPVLLTIGILAIAIVIALSI